MPIDAYTLYIHYQGIKEIFEKNQVVQAKVFGFINGDLGAILHDLDVFISVVDNQYVTALVKKPLQALLFPHKPSIYCKDDLKLSLFGGPLGVKKLDPNFQTPEAQEAYMNNKIARAIALEEVAARGKVMGAFAALICRELEACNLTFDVVRSRQFTPAQKTAMANIHIYFETLKDLPRYEGDADFFKGLERICFNHASSPQKGPMYNHIAQEFIVARKEGEKYAQELGIQAIDIESSFPLELQTEIQQIFTRHPQAIASALKPPVQYYSFIPSDAGGNQNPEGSKQQSRVRP